MNIDNLLYYFEDAIIRDLVIATPLSLLFLATIILAIIILKFKDI